MNQKYRNRDFNIKSASVRCYFYQEFNSIMHIAEFDSGDGLIVSYVFNITTT